MPEFDSNVSVVKFFDWNLESKRFRPDRGIVVIENRKCRTCLASTSGRVKYAILDRAAIVVNHDGGDLDVPGRGLATPLEVAAVERHVQVVPYLARHDHVREPDPPGLGGGLEQDRLLLAHLAGLAGEEAGGDPDAAGVAAPRRDGAELARGLLEDEVVQVVGVLVVAHLELGLEVDGGANSEK